MTKTNFFHNEQIFKNVEFMKVLKYNVIIYKIFKILLLFSFFL